MKLRRHATIIDHASTDSRVERPAPGQAPTAFRVWQAGENTADDGSIFFTKESAEKLMAEQDARGRIYSIDFDHLSLLSDRPAESGRAAGWHTLEVRDGEGGPELWAINIEWCADVKSGLEEVPPRWRFFSPAFGVNADGVVTTYVNFALCINPLTHKLPSLSARTSGELTMDKLEAAKAYALMASADASEDDKKAAAKMLAEYFGEEETKDDKKEEPAEEKKEAADGCEDEKKSEPVEEKKEAAEGDDEEKMEAKAVNAMATDLVKANKRIEALEIEGLLRERADLAESLKRWCATQTPDVVKGFLKANPRMSAKRNETPIQGPGTGAYQQLPAGDPQRETIEKAFGVNRKDKAGIEREADGTFLMHTQKPSEFRAKKMAQLKAGK